MSLLFLTHDVVMVHDGSRWLFNFRWPSIICQSSASPRVLRLLSLRCRFVPSISFSVCTVLGLTIYRSTYFLPGSAPLLQSKSTNIWVHHILRLSVSAQEKLNAYDCLCHLNHRNLLELHKASAPELSGTFLNTWGFTDYLHGKPPQPHQVSASEPSKTSQGPVSAPKPSGTSPATCTLTFRNLPAPEPCATSGYLHRNPPEPHQVSAPEPSGTSTGHLHRNPFGTLRNFARNLLLKLHRIAPELIWAKDPIAKFIKFCC